MEKNKRKWILVLAFSLDLVHLALEEIKAASGKLTSQLESTWSMQAYIPTYIAVIVREEIDAANSEPKDMVKLQNKKSCNVPNLPEKQYKMAWKGIGFNL